MGQRQSLFHRDRSLSSFTQHCTKLTITPVIEFDFLYTSDKFSFNIKYIELFSKLKKVDLLTLGQIGNQLEQLVY